MPITVIYREDGGVMFDAGEGTLTGEDVVEANKSIYADETKLTKLKYQLCDYTKAEKFEFSDSEIRIIAEQDRNAAALNPRMLVAIAGSDDLMFGLARMWEAYVDQAGFETAVFRELEAAESWIEAQLQKHS